MRLRTGICLSGISDNLFSLAASRKTDEMGDGEMGRIGPGSELVGPREA